jgi:glyoxylase-like metal-dependent hydrolase (beta-lactamase superfamily II)
VAILEHDRILFAGDLLYTDYHPVTVYGDIPIWIRSIDNLLERKFVTVVPGHGPISTGGNDAYKRAFVTFRSYLGNFHDQLNEVKTGKKSPGDVESYMKSGKYAAMGKTWMVKRNIEYFLKEAK